MKVSLSFFGFWFFGLSCAALFVVGCKKGGAADNQDGASDGLREAGVIACPPVGDDMGAGGDGGTMSTDDFGPNAPAMKTASAIGRVNIYEVISPQMLTSVDIFVRAGLPHTRLTVAVQEASSRTSSFSKLADVQIDVDVCEGWASSGPLQIPLSAGRFYAVGFDPNQVVTAFVSTDADSLPIDGAFGRLIGSKTATSVSVPSLAWDKFSDKEYNRQRLSTSPRNDDGTAPDAALPPNGGDASADGGVDGARDASDGARG